jgi:hypothetical protein
VTRLDRIELALAIAEIVVAGAALLGGFAWLVGWIG